MQAVQRQLKTEEGSTPRELQWKSIYAEYQCFFFMKPTHNPQLFLRTVLQICELRIQRCFTGLKTSLSYFRVEWADRKRGKIGSGTKNRKEVKAHQVGGCLSVQYVHICCICVHWFFLISELIVFSVYSYSAHTFHLMAANCWINPDSVCEWAQTNHISVSPPVLSYTTLRFLRRHWRLYYFITGKLRTIPLSVTNLQESCIWFSKSLKPYHLECAKHVDSQPRAGICCMSVLRSFS